MLKLESYKDMLEPLAAPDIGEDYNEAFERELSDFLTVRMLSQLVVSSHSQEWRESGYCGPRWGSVRQVSSCQSPRS